MKNKLDFKHILIISPREVCCTGLADGLGKYLPEPKFTFLNQLTDTLPDQQFDWSDIDLMMIDLSRHKRAIYDWYAQDGSDDYLPPAIFLGHPASFKDAGYFFRVGASDYLDLQGLRTSQLLESLVAVNDLVEKKRQIAAEIRRHDDPSDRAKALPLKFMETGEMDIPPEVRDENANYEEVRAEFINTGIMNILDRDELRKMLDNDPKRKQDK